MQPSMTVMDVGSGMGVFSIAMAKMVGDKGRMIAVDLQQEMLDVLRKRAKTQGVSDRIQTHRWEADRLCAALENRHLARRFGVQVSVDFVLAFMMIFKYRISGDCLPKFTPASSPAASCWWPNRRFTSAARNSNKLWPSL